MVVTTAMLVFTLLVFMPIRVKAGVSIFPSKLSTDIYARIMAIKVFDESITLKGKFLHCSGTVDACMDITAINGKNGVDLLKCITVDRVFVSVLHNVFNLSSLFTVFVCAVMALSTAIACHASHCQICARQVMCADTGKIFVGVVVSANIAELSFCLLKQGVEQWKIRKSEK